VIFADADDLGRRVEGLAELGDNDGRKAHRECLVLDMRPGVVLQQPVLAAEHPGVYLAPGQEIDGATGSFGRNEMLLQDRQIGCHDDTAVETRTRPVDAERLHQGRYAAGWPAADDREGNAGLSDRRDSRPATVGQLLVIGDQCPVHVGNNGGYFGRGRSTGGHANRGLLL
jgi:hypothetical protein